MNSENVMEVDNGQHDDITTQPLDLTIDNHNNPPIAHPEYLVRVTFETPNLPNLVVEEVEIDQSDQASDNELDRISPTVSITSSNPDSPYILGEESNQSIEQPKPPEISQESSRKRSLSEDDKEEDGMLCPICLDNWTTTGDHRICALKCGHLFGYKCVHRWLELESRKSCPTCKKRVRRGDLRYIYAKKLIAVDTSELENVKRQLKLVTDERNQTTAELACYITREHLLNQELADLKKQLSYMNGRRDGNLILNSSNKRIVKLYMDKSMEICKLGGCRVFDTNSKLDLLMASIKSPNHLFSGFGLKKLNISNYKQLAFIPIHSQQIRDVSFHRENNWILSASMDKTFKVVDNTTNSITHFFHHQMPLWSCCWDVNNQNVLYVGTQFGAVIKYDIRHLSEPVCTLAVEDDASPVVSIASIPAGPGETLPHGGVISCKLSSLWVFENTYPTLIRHPLSLEGPFISMKYQQNTKHLLVSSRPNSRTSYSRHTLCTLDKDKDGRVKSNIVHSFQGGGMQKLLSKSCFVSNSNEYVAAHLENSKSVYLWSINSGEKVASVPALETVLDLKGVGNQNGDYLVSLTEKKLDFFKFIE